MENIQARLKETNKAFEIGLGQVLLGDACETTLTSSTAFN
jgi:hypothetical protein